jgi:transcriptional regulator with XRE-family HTH domain
MKPTLGEFIRKRRDVLGLTQRNVAETVGFKSLAHLSDIEGGKRNPGEDVMPKLAAALQVSIDELEAHDVRASLQATRDLLEDRPELVAAFRRVVNTARDISPEELIRRVERRPEPNLFPAE